MTIKLLQELKAAGFPQGGKGEFRDLGYFVADRDYHEGESVPINTPYYIPSLSELISACGEIVLWPFNGAWYAGKPDDERMGGRGESYYDEYPKPVECGPTPEEAVARLYLAIHGKS